MCDVLKLVHMQRSRLNLTHGEIATRMSHYLGDRVSDDSVQRYFSGNTGVPLESMGALLTALGLKVVQADSVTVPEGEYEALKVLAKKALE